MKRQVLASAQRVLGLMDRCEGSATFGCMDRGYWHYRGTSDFPGATWQQPVFGLALLYKKDFPGNHFYGSGRFLRWLEAALLWWTKIQNRDGSFSEWYANERSFCATAFTSWAVCRGVLELDSSLSGPTREVVVRSLLRSGEWLAGNDNPATGNQMAAALAALTAIFACTGSQTVQKGMDRKKEWILAHQRREGWLPEYGGADPGYGTIALECLADAGLFPGDGSIRDAALKLLGWLAPLYHPDGTVGGCLGSRGGEIALPGGVSLLGEDPRAAYILKLHRRGIEAGEGAGPEITDDRYLAYFQFNSAVRGFLGGSHEGAGVLEGGYRPPPHVFFEDAGLAALRPGDITSVIALKAGGTLKVYRGDAPFYMDGGYIVEDGDGGFHVGRSVATGEGVSFDDDGNGAYRAETRTALRQWDRNRPAGAQAAMFKVLSHILLHFSPAERFASRQLKRRLVTEVRPSPYELHRRFRLTAGRLEISDKLARKNGPPLRRILKEPTAFLGCSPSARSYRPGDLADGPGQDVLDAFRNRINAGGKGTLQVSVDLSGAKATITSTVLDG